MTPQVRISLLYALVCSAWIALSDRLLLLILGAHVELLAAAQLVKGISFVLFTAAGLFLLLRREFRQREAREQDLKAVNRTLQTIMDASPVAIYALDRDSRVTFWSPAAEELFGWKAEEIIGRVLRNIPEDRQVEAADIKTRMLSGERFSVLEVERMRKDGRRVLVRAASAPTVDAAGNVTGILAIVQDVTAEKETRRTVEHLAAIVNASDDAVFAGTPEGRIASWNPAAERLYGYRADEVMGRPMSILAPGDESDASMFSGMEAGRRLDHVETVVKTRDGRRVEVAVSAFPIESGEGGLMTAVVARDVTELKRTQAQLAYQANLLQNVSDAIVAVDTDWRVTSWNRAAEKLYGWSASEVMGKLPDDFLHTEYIDVSEDEAIRAMLETGHWQGEVVEYRKDGSAIRIFNSTSLLRDAAGQTIGAVGIERDITWQHELAAETANRQRLQVELEHEVEMRAIRNRFVSMVSHEFRTPLAAIQSATDLLLHYMERMTLDQRENRLKQVQDHVKRITELLNDFLILSRMETVGLQLDPRPADMVELLNEMVETARESWPNHQIELFSAEACPPISLDHKLIRQALLNLLSNAIKYSPEAAPVIIRLSRQTESVRVEIKDRGIGIPEEDQPHLFEQFYRASNVGATEGTGLGLAIVQRAIAAHGGSVTVESKVGVGTTIGFTLPLTNGGEP